MTEAEWLACAELQPIKSFMFWSRRMSNRKRKLFEIGCCRQVWHVITDAKCRRAIDAAEMNADGLVSEDELAAARSGVRVRGNRANTIGRLAFFLAGGGNISFPIIEFTRQLALRHDKTSETEAMSRQVDMLRDLVGNPFRRVRLDLSWLAWNNGAIHKMAQSIYDDRAFDHLPLLADALEDAGCDDADILSHCRTPGEHVRGCWVVDLLLGKS